MAVRHEPQSSSNPRGIYQERMGVKGGREEGGITFDQWGVGKRTSRWAELT